MNAEGEIYSIILDTNLLIYSFINIVSLPPGKITLREKIYSKVARYILFESPYHVIIPDFILDIELPRALSKIIIKKYIIDPNKLKTLVNIPSRIKKIDIPSLTQLGKCTLINTWQVKYFKETARLYKNLPKENRGKHQDILIIAIAKTENSTIITGDYDIYHIINTRRLHVKTIYITPVGSILHNLGEENPLIKQLQSLINSATTP